MRDLIDLTESLFQQHVCWCVQFLREDGFPAGRCEYFADEEKAKRFYEGSTLNGAKLRLFKMREVEGGQ